MELERWINEHGVDPTKLTKKELVKEITRIGDFGTMADCIRYLFEIDKELATQSLLQVMTTNQEDKNYADKFYQAMFLGSLFGEDEERALKYILDNYTKMEDYVFAEALSNITYVEEGEFQEVRNLLKHYINEKGTDYFKELKQIESTKDVIQNFLESFE